MSKERRRHPRLAICLPISHRLAGEDMPHRQDFTVDIAPGGVYFSVAGKAPSVGQQLDVQMSIPPGEGYSPHAGKVNGLATVLRAELVLNSPEQRWLVAARFDQPLNLMF